MSLLLSLLVWGCSLCIIEKGLFLHVYQWFFQGTVNMILLGGRIIIVAVDLGFQTQKTVSIGFNRLKIFLPNDRLYYFLEENLKSKKIYLHTIKNRDRFGEKIFFAEIYIDPENFPVAKEKSLNLRDINRSLATGVQPLMERVNGLINVNDFLVEHGLAEYVERDNLPLRHGSSRGSE
jgi:hypothetical protein